MSRGKWKEIRFAKEKLVYKDETRKHSPYGIFMRQIKIVDKRMQNSRIIEQTEGAVKSGPVKRGETAALWADDTKEKPGT
ncbi:MAG: hypothetical protein HFF61_09700 [Oscillospiraceae bacterium]|nr:hypothetical protein [Oscillospiraceae bacterium]